MSKNGIAHNLIEYRCHLYSTSIKNVFKFLCSRTMNGEITPINNNTPRRIVMLNLSAILPTKQNDIVNAGNIHCKCTFLDCTVVLYTYKI